MNDTHERAQAATLKFPRGRVPTFAPGVVLAPRHAEKIAHVGPRIDVPGGGDHLIPVGWPGAK